MPHGDSAYGHCSGFSLSSHWHMLPDLEMRVLLLKAGLVRIKHRRHNVCCSANTHMPESKRQVAM